MSAAKKTPTTPSHPPFKDMIVSAISKLGDKKGSSRQAIKKHVLSSNKVSEQSTKTNLNKMLTKMLASGQLVHPKSSTGRYKLAAPKAPAQQAAKKKTVVAKKKKPAAKKAAVGKESTKKTVAKKPKAKKTPVKKAAAKKSATVKKSAAKKPAAKRPASKKSPKKVVKKAAKKTSAKKK